MSDLGNVLGLPPSNIIICVLHAKERLCENVLRITLSLIEKKEEFWAALISVKGLECLKIVEEQEWNELKIFLHGDTCNTLLENVDTVVKFLQSETGKALWYTLKNFLKKIDNKAGIDDLQVAADDFWKFYVKHANAFEGKSWYAHILVKHTIPLQKRIGCIKMFETQAFESQHVDDEQVLNDCTSRGGGYEFTYLNFCFSAKEIMIISFTTGWYAET